MATLAWLAAVAGAAVVAYAAGVQRGEARLRARQMRLALEERANAIAALEAAHAGGAAWFDRTYGGAQ
jgi:hypothetical protein